MAIYAFLTPPRTLWPWSQIRELFALELGSIAGDKTWCEDAEEDCGVRREAGVYYEYVDRLVEGPAGVLGLRTGGLIC